MKLAIVGWRPWTATQRYKSLMVNAQKLGHEVLGVITDHYGDGPTTTALFQALGVPTVPLSFQALDEFDPDAVLGECFWGQEITAVLWAQSRGKKYFVLDHSKMAPPTLETYSNNKPPGTALVVSETNAQLMQRDFGIPAVPVGFPNFDVDHMSNRDGTRQRLRLTEQPCIGFFPAELMDHRGTGLDEEREVVLPFLDLAYKRGWGVLAHLHPEEQGRKFKCLDRGHPRHAFLKELQDRGVTFVSCIPGSFSGVVFEPCSPMALVRCVDVVTGTYDATFQAYAGGKRFLHLNEVEAAIEEGSSAVVQEPAYVRQWFHALDGECWRRILDAVCA